MRNIIATIIALFLLSTMCSSQMFLKHPITGEEFEVAPNDFTIEMTYDEAQKACKKLKGGWRLPTIEELEAIYLSNKDSGNFKDFYWAEDGHWFSFKEGKGGKGAFDQLNPPKKYLRAVRNALKETDIYGQ